MSVEQNKAKVQRFYEEILRRGKLDVIDQIVAPNFVDHNPNNPTHDRAGLMQFVKMMRTAFPDVSAKVVDLIGEGDRVAARITITGTHLGDFMGMPPSGKRFEIGCIDIVRCVDGKALEHWTEADDLGMLKQLGALPELSPV